MKKTGLTLMEVLITIAIIGVVAALVIPSLVNNMQDTHAGVTLARMVEQIETGCRSLIDDVNNKNSSGTSVITTIGDINAGDISHTGDASDDSSLAQSLAESAYTYLNLEPLSDSESTAAKDGFTTYSGEDISQDDSTAISEASVFKSKKINATIYICQVDADDLSDEDSTIANVYIDTNGYKKAPNAFGRDLFVFELKNNGKMIPYGLDEDDNYKDNCSDTNITNGKACTARVVADGWEVNY